MSNAPRSTTQRDRDRNAIKRERPPCGICGGGIDYALPYLDPMSYVVDHVIPLAKGGPDALANKQAAHRDCNQTKSAKLNREVVLICGPPGAGKTTLAQSLGLTVYDVDDPQWSGNETLFRSALGTVGVNPEARATVVRCAATMSSRQSVAQLCKATRIHLIDTPLDVCIERIVQRGRTSPPIKTQIAAATDWWRKYEPGMVATAATIDGPRTFVTGRAW